MAVGKCDLDIITAIPIQDKFILYFPNGKDPVLLDSELRCLGKLDARIKSAYRIKSENGANFGRNRGIYGSKIYFISEEKDNTREHFLRVADLSALLLELGQPGAEQVSDRVIPTTVLTRNVEEFAISPHNGILFTLTNSGNIEVLGTGVSRQLDPDKRYGVEFYSAIGLHRDSLVVAGCCPKTKSYMLFGLTRRLEIKFRNTYDMPTGNDS